MFKGKRLVVLNIPDRYECMQPELVKVLKAKVAKSSAYERHNV